MTAALPAEEGPPHDPETPQPMREWLDGQSPLARSIEGFVPREQQIAFADAVARTIAQRGALVQN